MRSGSKEDGDVLSVKQDFIHHHKHVSFFRQLVNDFERCVDRRLRGVVQQYNAERRADIFRIFPCDFMDGRVGHIHLFYRGFVAQIVKVYVIVGMRADQMAVVVNVFYNFRVLNNLFSE